MWLSNVSFLYISIHTCTPTVGPPGNFLVTLTSSIKKKGKQIGKAAQVNNKFIKAEDNIFLVIHTLTFLPFSLPSDIVT